MPDNTALINPGDRTLNDHRSVKPRLTIARMMIVVAVAAVFSALARSSPSLAVCLLWAAANIGVGWLIYLGCRRRRRIIPRIYLAILGVGFVMFVFGLSMQGILGGVAYVLSWIIVVHPATLGLGLAWDWTGRQESVREDLRAVFLIVNMVLWSLFVVIPMYLILLIVLAFHVFGGIARD